MSLGFNKKKFIFFSKSYWDEVPRLRHQVARLLISNGHDVIFFEKPVYFFQKSKSEFVVDNDCISIKCSKQLVHHQLRLTDTLQRLNAFYERQQISKYLKKLKSDEYIVINFNYDYAFIRKLFPSNKILTIINDDFVAQAKFFQGRHVRNCLEKTCKISDRVFVVSHPLQDQLKKWSDPELFLPWANNPYMKPKKIFNRNSVLIWAHIDRRIDFDVVEALAAERSDLNIDLIGPVGSVESKKVKKLKDNYSNINIDQPVEIEMMNADKYFCSLIPYRSNVPDIEAVTASNKTFQLLAKGLPIVTHGMPNFYRHPAIFNCSTIEAVYSAIDCCHDNFYELQPCIKELVDVNQATDRYNQLMKAI